MVAQVDKQHAAMVADAMAPAGKTHLFADVACAQRAAEYGARVALIESGRLGGTCVNVGCVPKKIMWNASEIREALNDGVDYGFRPTPAGHDWASLRAKRDAYVERLNGLYARNLASRKVEHIQGRASFIGPQLVAAAGRTLGAPHIVIATGGASRDHLGRLF